MFGLRRPAQVQTPPGKVLITPGSRFADDPPVYDPYADPIPFIETGGFVGLWQKTVGTLTLDFKRPVLPKDAERTSLFRMRRPRPPRVVGHTPLGTPVTRPAGRPVSRSGGTYEEDSSGLVTFPDVAFGNSGARIKVMRHVRLGPSVLAPDAWWPQGRPLPSVDLGIGGQLNFDTAAVQPKARLKFQDWLSLRLLPVPSIKLQKRFVIPGSGAGVKVSYECPLEELRSFWQPPARLMVSIESGGPRGFRLTQGGVEFDQRFVVPGGKAVVRAAGQLGLPPQLPLEEDEPLVRATLQRAGLKALW